MAIGLLGRKVGMTQIFDEAGNVVPVTVIEAGPCHVLQLRTDGARRLRSRPAGLSRQAPPSGQPQSNVVTSPSSTASARKRRAKAGVEPLAKADCEPQRFVREFRGADRAS